MKWLEIATDKSDSTVHAIIRVDEKHAITLADSEDWTLSNANYPFDVNTVKRDYTCRFNCPIDGM